MDLESDPLPTEPPRDPTRGFVNLGKRRVFTEVVPTAGGERELISNRYTVTTRMISAFRWAAMPAILMYH